MIVYDKLWETLKEKGITKYKLIHKYNIPKYTLVRMSRNMPTSSATIDDLCKILNCEVSEIMSYVPDEDFKKCKSISSN